MLVQPKPYLDKLKLRREAYGTERRRNMSKLILEKGTPFPLPIEYSDIDRAMFEWVDKKIHLVYDGKRLPTYKLYSTQRLSEYVQTWKDNDETNSPVLNFKTITREFNPQKGEIQGGYFNIPGHKDFAMFYVPVLQENGTEAFDRYTMKQPFGVNFTYSVSIVTNKMEILNEMNEQMLYEFNAINCYIEPNGHPMSMSLEDISDNSEYTIDDRKYYSQTYKIKVKGYIIRKEDFKVERIPSRFVMSSHDSDASGIVNRRGKNRRKDERVVFMEDTMETKQGSWYRKDSFDGYDKCEVPIIEGKPRHVEIYEETDGNDACCNTKEKYRFRVVRVDVSFDDCTNEVSFEIDKDLILVTIETENVYDFRLIVNEEPMNLENEIKFYNGDLITLRITKDDEFKESRITLVCDDPNNVIDNEYDINTTLDDPISVEEIEVDEKEGDKDGI